MFTGGLGLTEVNSKDLEKALRALYRGDLELPLNIHGLTRVGLQHCSQPLLSQLRGLDKMGVQAVLVAVLAERKTALLPD
jgi:hypothetical protein